MYSLPYSADVKNQWSYASPPYSSNVFMACRETSPFNFTSLQTQKLEEEFPFMFSVIY
jgi:hypothetical protein